jgi:MFS family permease
MNQVNSREFKTPLTTRPRRWPTEPDFWRLWLIGAIQFSVRWIEMLTIAITVYEMTGSALLVTFLTMLRILPMALLGAFIGAAADRFEGRSALIATTSIQAMTSTTIALLAFTGQLQIWNLAVSVFVNGCAWAGDNAFRRLMIGRVVGADQMSNAMTFDTGSSNVSRLAGPAIGGAVLATWGIGGCFVLGAAMYLLSVAAALRLRYRHQELSEIRGFLLHEILDALRVIKNSKHLIGILSVTLIFNLFAWPILSLIPVIGHDNLHLGPSGVGFLASMEGVGAICGLLTVFIFARPEHQATLYTYSVPIYTVALIAFALMPHPVPAGFALIIAGFGGSGFSITQSAIVFRSVRLDMRARMLGLLTVSIGMGPIGFLQIGLLADAIGAKYAIVTSGAEGLIALLLTRRFWREIK